MAASPPIACPIKGNPSLLQIISSTVEQCQSSISQARHGRVDTIVPLVTLKDLKFPTTVTKLGKKLCY